MPAAGNEDRRHELASLIATEVYRDGVLWWEPVEGWFARSSPDQPWLRGRQATSLRNSIITRKIIQLRTTPPYSTWKERRSLEMNWGQYDLYRRMQWIWEDWGRPEDLPA